jgi:hypothetical protein
MRWQEEVTLTSYEMQWTVRFFSHKSQKWADVMATSLADEAGPKIAGPIAYGNRKKAMWLERAFTADRTFTLFNPAYKSPL